MPNPEAGNPYEKLQTKLNNHYLPKKNKHYARYQFLKLRPNPGESTSSYAARLREKATDCEFGDTHDDRILEHIIQTIENKTLIHKSINKAWDLTQFLIEAAQMENIKRQVCDITSPEAEVKAGVNREGQAPKPRQKRLIEYNHQGNNITKPGFPETAQDRSRRDDEEPARRHINANIVGTIIEKETTAQLLERDVGNAIKKITFPQYADQQVPRELIPRNKALDKTIKVGESNGPLRKIHQSVQTMTTLYKRLQIAFKPRKLHEHKNVNKL